MSQKDNKIFGAPLAAGKNKVFGWPVDGVSGLDGGAGGSGAGSGTVAYFETAAARDAYYAANPGQLKSGVSVGVGSPVQAYTYDGKAWVAGALALKGDRGDPGKDGANGVDAIADITFRGKYVSTVAYARRDAVVGSDGNQYFVNGEKAQGVDPVGDKTGTWVPVIFKGAPGEAATVKAGKVTTLPAGSAATVTNSGTTNAAVFDFGIPKGADGTGTATSGGISAAQLNTAIEQATASALSSARIERDTAIAAATAGDMKIMFGASATVPGAEYQDFPWYQITDRQTLASPFPWYFNRYEPAAKTWVPEDRPYSPTVGDSYLNYDTQTFYMWSGSAWQIPASKMAALTAQLPSGTKTYDGSAAVALDLTGFATSAAVASGIQAAGADIAAKAIAQSDQKYLQFVTIAPGSANGTIKVTTNLTPPGTTAPDIPVQGLKPGAFADVAPAQVNADWKATSGLEQILNKPVLFSGSYADLTGKPDLTQYAQNSGLAPVAKTGAYADLTGKPTIPATFLESIKQGNNVTIDYTDPKNPVIAVSVSGMNYRGSMKTWVAPASPANGDFYAVTSPVISFRIFNGSAWDEIDFPTQIQADWSVTDSGSPAFIKGKPSFSAVAVSGSYSDLLNKPTIPGPADWQTLLNKPTITLPVQADWNVTDAASLAFIKNKPPMYTPYQANWAQTDAKAIDYIREKPTLYTPPSTGIPASQLDPAVQAQLAKAGTAYQPPVTGIPATALDTTSQQALAKAGTSYQKPTTGIPSGDLSDGVRISLAKADAALPNTTQYAGSAKIGGAANSVAYPLSIQVGTKDAAVFDGSAAQTVTITPETVGALSSAVKIPSSQLEQSVQDAIARPAVQRFNPSNPVWCGEVSSGGRKIYTMQYAFQTAGSNGEAATPLTLPNFYDLISLSGSLRQRNSNRAVPHGYCDGISYWYCTIDPNGRVYVRFNNPDGSYTGATANVFIKYASTEMYVG
jgi:hypothetical protein